MRCLLCEAEMPAFAGLSDEEFAVIGGSVLCWVCADAEGVSDGPVGAPKGDWMAESSGATIQRSAWTGLGEGGVTRRL
jgi:hypothetical protein